MPTSRKSTARRWVGTQAVRAARAARFPRLILAAPTWVWPAIEVATAVAVIAVGATGAWSAWEPLAQLGAPWWTGLLALAVPAGAAARLAKAAPTAVTEYCNRRDHSIETLKGRLS